MDIQNFINEDETIFGDRQDLIRGLNTFLPDNYKIAVKDLQVPEKKSILQSAIDLVNLVKLRLPENEYRAFLNAVAVLSENQYGKVVSYLVGHRDLLQEFVRIVSCSGPIPEDRETDSEGYCMEKLYRKGLDLFERIKANIACDNSDEYLKFLKRVHDYSQNRIAMADVVQSFAKHPQAKAEFKELLEGCENIVRERPKTEKKQCTPSYWHLPRDHCRGSGLCAQELNDEWVCKSLVEEKYFKNRPITEREEILNNCEDDRHELDLLLNRLRSTTVKMEEILSELMSENKIINIEDHLSVLHFKCIQNLYGELSDGVIEALNNNPTVVVPVILNRLKKKVAECEEYRVVFNNQIWASVQAELQLD